MPITKKEPHNTLQVVRLNQHEAGVDLVLGFSDGQYNLVTLDNSLDKIDVSKVFRELSLEISQFEIH